MAEAVAAGDTMERYGGLVVQNVRRPQTHIERIMLSRGEAPGDLERDLVQWVIMITRDNCWDVD